MAKGKSGELVTDAGTPSSIGNGASPNFGQRRVVVMDVQPRIEDGRYAVKRVLGDVIEIACDLISDGHDLVDGVVRYRGLRIGAAEQPIGANSAAARQGPEMWQEAPLNEAGNDRYTGQFTLSTLGTWEFQIEAWIDVYGSWCHGLKRKFDDGQDVSVDLMAGINLITQARARVTDDTEEALAAVARLEQALACLNPTAGQEQKPMAERVAEALDEDLLELMRGFPDRTTSSRSLSYALNVEPVLARFSSWYELFPRSFGKAGQHGTFADVEAMLPYVASMGFDILYFPPIHPIGNTHRKGPNNTLQAAPSDPGSPWAIGAAEGGHTAIHPQLGSEADFIRLVSKAREVGLEVALDIAFQASPDHPYVKEHPEWFVHRADGSIQYAENPPKKYQDVYPFDLAGSAWSSLWEELHSVFQVWIARGVRVFRVDNPHTKPIPFWEYCIREIKRAHPDVLFLAEAFTRPKLMYALAKVGFSQSYTYFTWRTTSREIEAYLTEITSPPVSDFFRPNFWPNTPDILPEHLQYGGRPMFVMRAILAGTLCSNWGIYGPAFELLEHVPRAGAEEYIDNEKFQLRTWDLEREDSLRPIIARLNQIRKDNPALQRNNVTFHASENDRVLAYSKADPASGNVILTVVNLEPQHKHSAWITLDLAALMVATGETFQVHDLISDARYQWSSGRVYVELDPNTMPVHVFLVRRRLRTERSFEYFL